MANELTVDQERYLQEAFGRSPDAWFRPADVLVRQHTPRELENLVAGLVSAGMLDGQPDCHARLTERGRRYAAQLIRPARDNWRREKARRRLIVTASTVAAVVMAGAALLYWSGLLNAGN